MKVRLPLLLFATFLCVQVDMFFTTLQCKNTPTLLHSPVHPFLVVTRNIQPPRRAIVLSESRGSHNIIPYFTLPPAVAYTLGRKMDWNHVSEEDLRQIPGISTTVAQRLIRLRDTEDISSLEELLQYPHIGRKTIQRLKTYCFIPNEP